MGTALTGLQIGSSYAGLLKTTDNLAVNGTLRTITDGLGNDTAISVSTAGLRSTGFLRAGTAGVHLDDTDSSHLLKVVAGSNLTADRTLTVATGDADRTLTITSNVTLDQNVGTAGSPSFAGINSTPIGATTPAAGTFTTLTALSGGNDRVKSSVAAAVSTLQLGSPSEAVFGMEFDRGSGEARLFSGTEAAKVTRLTIGATGDVAVAGAITLGTALAVGQGGTGSTSASAARTALGLAIGTDVQAFDADLSALAALSGTNTIYYRSAANTWSAVTIGSNLSFSGGTLSASGGGGGTIGGTTGGNDNRILRADGTGGATVDASAVSIDDSGNVTGAATYDAGTGGYKVSGTKVLGVQASAEGDMSIVTSVSGGDTVDLGSLASNFGQIQGKFNSLLSKLRTHGIIAT